MRKVLILSCNTGQGHNSCAQAIKSYFELQNVTCKIEDALALISKGVSDFLSAGHIFVYRYLPWLFRWGYCQSEKHPAVFQRDSIVYRELTSGTERMYQQMTEGGFDTVVCTHIFSAIMLTHMLEAHPVSVQTAFISTDYTCYPGASSCNLQKYFVADECVSDALVGTGVPRERIIPSGIPVRREFFDHVEKRDAKRLLNLHPDRKHLLVMCGSMGCGPIARMVKRIAANMTKDMEISVLCGTNKRLFQKLQRRYQKQPAVHIIDYTDQMSLYMDAADLYLTKPGGISVAEAAVKCLPMAFINAVAGCEQYNMDYFINMGAAITDKSPEKLAEKSVLLLNSEIQLRRMHAALKEHKPLDGAACVFTVLKGGRVHEYS